MILIPAGARVWLAAGVTDRLWDVENIVALLEAVEEAASKKRGPYKKRQTV